MYWTKHIHTDTYMRSESMNCSIFGVFFPLFFLATLHFFYADHHQYFYTHLYFIVIVTILALSQLKVEQWNFQFIWFFLLLFLSENRWFRDHVHKVAIFFFSSCPNSIYSFVKMIKHIKYKLAHKTEYKEWPETFVQKINGSGFFFTHLLWRVNLWNSRICTLRI